MRANIDALTESTPWLKKAPARRYKPDGTPVTTRVKASVQRSHNQIFNPGKPGYRTVNHLDDALAIRFVREREATRLYRFVYRNGELTRVQ